MPASSDAPAIAADLATSAELDQEHVGELGGPATIVLHVLDGGRPLSGQCSTTHGPRVCERRPRTSSLCLGRRSVAPTLDEVRLLIADHDRRFPTWSRVVDSIVRASCR